MAKKFPIDEFDSVTASAGLHRAPRTWRDRLFSALTFVASVAVVSGAGIGTLMILSGNTQTDTGVGITDNNVTPVVETFKGDGLGVMVVDASGQKQVATKLAHKLLDAGWNVYGTANGSAATQITSAKTTVVYINSESAKDAATALLADVGKYEIKVSNFFQDPITIMIGKDFSS